MQHGAHSIIGDAARRACINTNSAGYEKPRPIIGNNTP